MSRLDRIHRGRRLATPEARQRRSEKVHNLQKKFGKGCYRGREARFVTIYLRLGWAFVKRNRRVPKREEAKQLARIAAVQAGYMQPSAGERLLRLDRVQEAINISFEKHELGLDESTRLIADIAHNGEVDGKRNDQVRLAAVRLRFALTTGFGPSKSANLQVHARADRFFEQNKEKFAKPPPIDAIEGQEQRMTERIISARPQRRWRPES